MTSYYAVQNQGNVPAILGGALAARPAAGQTGRLYVSNEGSIFRDSGATWAALSGDDAASILAKLLTVDGTGSGLDTDTFRGLTPGDFAFSTDTRLSNARTPTGGAGGDLSGSYPNPQIAAGAIVDADVSAAAAIAKSKLASLQIVDADVSAAAAIAEAKLALASDAAPTTPSRRTLGTGANQALPGNDARLRTIRDEGIGLTNRAIMDFTGAGVIVTDDAAGGRTQINVSGTAAGSASETAAGIGELGTDVEIQTVVTGSAFRDFLVSVFRLREELDRRLTPEAWHVVGATGEPAFENAWVNFGTPNETAAFYKDVAGRVHIRGTIKNGTVAAGATGTAFTLPVGYRPAATLPFLGARIDSTTVDAKITLLADGSVRVVRSASSVEVSLNGISFRVA